MRQRSTQQLLLTALALGTTPSVLLSQTQSPVVELSAMGAKPNDPNLNSRDALQKALAALASKGGGTLHIAAGQYYVDFPDIASDVDPKDPASQAVKRQKNLTRTKLIMVPPKVEIVGDNAPGGAPSTVIHWKNSGFPVLSIVNADHAAIRNIAFVHDGLQPHFFPWAQEDYLQAVGVPARWLGGPYEISAVIYEIGSDAVRLENLAFTSGTGDNEHTFAFGVVVKGKTPIPAPTKTVVTTLAAGGRVPGGGLAACTNDNVFRNINFSRFVMGILASGQCSPVFDGITGDYRGSWYRSFDPTHERGGSLQSIGPPGHLIYITFQDAYDVLKSAAHPDGEMALNHSIRNTNVTLRNISEGPDTFSNYNSLGTLALKNIDGGTVDGVKSRHPEGLIQSMADAHNLTLRNLSWASERDLCSEPDSKMNCDSPAISLVPGPDLVKQFNENLEFDDVTLKSPRWASMFQITSAPSGSTQSGHIQVNSLNVECSPAMHAGQSGPKGIITIVRADLVHFSNVIYTPVISQAPTSAVNYAALIDKGSTHTTLDLVIKRPATNLPDNSQVYRSLVAGHGPNDELTGEDGNTITRRFSPTK